MARPPLRAQPFAAAAHGCASNRECGGDGAVCRRADGVCVTLASPDCAVLADPKAIADDATIWLGAMFPRTGESAAGYGTFNVNALELARRDFATAVGGLPSPRAGGPARPLGLVVCDDVVDAGRAARHLVDDLRVPAVIGFKDSREVIELATTIFIPRRVPAIAAINHSAQITELSHPPGQPRYVLRVALGTRGRTDAIAALVSGWIEPKLAAAGQVGPRRPLRVAMVHADNATGVADVDGIASALRFNGRAALENGDDFHAFPVPASDPAAHAALVARLVAYEPHVVINSALPPEDAELLERRRHPRAPRFYLIWPGALPVSPTDPFLAFIAENDERRGHILGLDLPTRRPANLRFVMAYNEAFPEQVGVGNSPGPSYDAFYLAAYAAYAAAEDPVTGEGLARAVARLVGPGPRVDVGPGKIVDALRLLHDGGSIDLAGTASNLDFDPATGESREDLAFLCIGREAPDRPLEIVEAGLVYESAPRALRGALRCP